MEKAKISLYQLYVLMVLFGLGSSSVVGLGATAKQDAWIAVILGTLGGIILFLIYGYLFKKYPDSSLIEIVEKILGKWIGRIIAILYILYFLYIATLVLRDITELILIYALTATPMLVLGILAIIVILYAIYLGIETITRFSEINFIIDIPLKVLFVLMAIISGITKFDNLKPVLENGLKPVLSAAFPLISQFPFGELIIFLMILPYVNKKEKAIKTGILAILTIGVVLVIVTIGNIITIGPLLTELSIFPTIQTTKLINIMDIIQRIEGLAVFTFVTCSLVKATIYAYSASIGLNIIFKTENYKKYIIPIVLIILFGSIYNAPNLIQHLYIGISIVPLYIQVPFEVVIPLILILVFNVKKLFNIKND